VLLLPGTHHLRSPDHDRSGQHRARRRPRRDHCHRHRDRRVRHSDLVRQFDVGHHDPRHHVSRRRSPPRASSSTKATWSSSASSTPEGSSSSATATATIDHYTYDGEGTGLDLLPPPRSRTRPFATAAPGTGSTPPVDRSSPSGNGVTLRPRGRRGLPARPRGRRIRPARAGRGPGHGQAGSSTNAVGIKIQGRFPPPCHDVVIRSSGGHARGPARSAS